MHDLTLTHINPHAKPDNQSWGIYGTLTAPVYSTRQSSTAIQKIPPEKIFGDRKVIVTIYIQAKTSEGQGYPLTPTPCAGTASLALVYAGLWPG